MWDCTTVVFTDSCCNFSVSEWHFISFRHYTGVSTFISKRRQCILLHTPTCTHHHNERVSSSYFGWSLLNCKSCQGLWLIVVFITILLSNQADHSWAWSSLIPAKAHGFMLIKGLAQVFIFCEFLKYSCLCFHESAYCQAHLDLYLYMRVHDYLYVSWKKACSKHST